MRLLRAILPVLLVVIAPAVLLYPLWSNPVSAGEDDVVYYYPLRAMVGQALRGGRLPLYNPREATGQPLMADPQAAVMYPPTGLFALTDAKLAYSLSIFLAFSLAGGGAYVYLRRLGMVRLACALGAVAFMFCGFMVGHRVHLSMIHTACYLPWGLWCIEGLRLRRNARWREAIRPALWMTPMALLALTAGHWPTMIHVGMIWTAYLLLRARPVPRSLLLAGAALALAVAIAWPQVALTRELLTGATRQRIGYAMAGENSFFPAAGVLALFPMLMGSRTPGFYPQQWWGAWHLCEMLGYVGLATLALAGAAVWRLVRRGGAGEDDDAPWRRLVRTWVLLGAAALVFMLGYYLPTYVLIHHIPVLGVMRCPARMVVAVDMALATLAAVAVHLICSAPPETARRLAAAVRRAAVIVLPLAMFAMLVTLAVAGWLMPDAWNEKIPFFFVGGARDLLAATDPGNAAVWVPFILVVATGLAVRYWLRPVERGRRCGGRGAVVLLVLLVDLFMVARFVDIPPASYAAPDPQVSPAGEWLRAHAPQDEPYRIWGLGPTYHHRPAELLLAKTCESLGFSTISNYGPFQSPAHSHLLGFRIFGTNRDWSRLIRRNYLLSVYGVRYIVAAGAEFRAVIESVRVPDAPPRGSGSNLLGGDWSLYRAEVDDGSLRMETPFLWSVAEASQPAALRAGDIYRISLDARGPEGGAANDLRADILVTLADGGYVQADDWALIAFAEQIGEDWRHFEWTFRMGETAGGQARFRLTTMSERPIEVRDISLGVSDWFQPLAVGDRLPAGAAVYRKLVELPARRADEFPVVIYENLLARTAAEIDPWAQPESVKLEVLKWPESPGFDLPAEPPNLAIAPTRGPSVWNMKLSAVFVVLYGLLAVLALLNSPVKSYHSQTSGPVGS